MLVHQFLDRKPGKRIDGYRNSEPRIVKVIGVGSAAGKAVERYNRARYGNVLAPIHVDAGSPVRIDQAVDGVQPNAIVLVLHGTFNHFPFVIERTAATLSVILVEPENGTEETPQGALPQVRAVADLFISTSDLDFVHELVENLAS